MKKKQLIFQKNLDLNILKNKEENIKVYQMKKIKKKIKIQIDFFKKNFKAFKYNAFRI